MAKITAIEIAPNRYLAVATLSSLAGNLVDPRRVDRSTISDRAKDPVLRNAYEQRGELQRKFDRARIFRAAEYGHYMQAVLRGGTMGVIPPVTLWTDDEPTFDPVHSELSVRGSTMFVASDGETQLAGRYMLANGFNEMGYQNPITEDRTWLDEPFAVMITTGSNREAAMQSLHDANFYATPIKAIGTNTMNLEGALTQAINAGIEASKVKRDRIKVTGELGIRPKYITLMSTLFHGAVGAAYGKQVMLASNPSTWIALGNKQFGTLNGKDGTVTAFIRDVLSLPDTVVRAISPGHMMALGVLYSKQGNLPPIEPEQCERIATRWKMQNPGRLLTRTFAELIYTDITRAKAA